MTGHVPTSEADAQSIAAVLTFLEDQAAKLGAESKVAGVWRDWVDLLAGRPLPWQTPWDLPRQPGGAT